MNIENPPKLESEMNHFQIPIQEYEEDMESESAKKKKQEILDLFANSNNLRTEEEFTEIKDDLHRACKEGDLELIKILLCERIENDSKDLIFKIDKTNQTASLFKVYDIKELIIPRTVQHKSTDYLITSITANLRDVKTIKFSEDSAVKTFYSDVFFRSEIGIEEIYFPSSLRELKKGWCRRAYKLSKINISPSNDGFIFKDDKYLLGKSDENNDEYDILLFANRNIEEISIPPNIKIISSSAFEDCRNLTKVEIPSNSNLQTIEKYAFYNSAIKKIYFPASLREFKKGWCHEAYKLRKINISPSNDRFIFKDNKYLLGKSDENKDEYDILLFANRNINKISIPPNIKIISSSAFEFCENLTKVEIPPKTKLQTIESFAFYSSAIKAIFIPPNISKICKKAFSLCSNLTKVEIPPNSILQTIESSAFYSSAIKAIFIPPSVSKICKKAFSSCSNLTKVEIPTNSNLQTIEEDTFSESAIKSIFIPPSVSKICESAFYFCENLTKVEIPKNSKLQTIKSRAFSRSAIKEISIPPNIKIISSSAFECCKNLTKVEIPPNSKLQTIESFVFYNSAIKEIFIPPSVSKICESAFYLCSNLTKVEIPPNSNLQTIESEAFSCSAIKEIYFPASLKELKEGWCHRAYKLRKINISPSNDRFIFKDNKYLLGKSDENKDEYDLLLFVNRDINEISIPPSIKVISSYAFERYVNLTKIEIPPNSNLQIIEKNAFSGSSIIVMFIPLDVLKMCEDELSDSNIIKYVNPADNEKSGTFIKKELSTVPRFDVPFDCSYISSLSLNSTDLVIITKDYKAIVCDDLKQKNFKEHSIKDHNDKAHLPISGFKSVNYDLYLVSEVEKGIKTKLVKNGHFLNIGKFHPVAIFCGTLNCAAIDLKGEILYIPGSFDGKSSKLIKPKHLPKGEKAVDIACLSDFVYALSFTGKLYMSKNASSSNITFEQVEEFRGINVIQISGTFEHILALTAEGKVYSKGKNLYGELGTGDKKDQTNKFVEISSLNRYKIRYVSAGEHHSLFLTTEGKILACGNNRSGQCFYESESKDVSIVNPVETSFRKGAEFCISSSESAAVCVGFDPEMSPNRQVKDEISILLFGCAKKTQILQAFINNKFENSSSDNQNEEEYIVNLEILRKVIKLRLIDAKKIDSHLARDKYYHRAINILYFFDSSNEKSFDEIDKIYEETKEIWDSGIQLVFVNCINSNSSSPKLKYNEIKDKYKCEIFEIGEDNNIQNINKPFYSFLQGYYKNQNEILKIGKQHRNPFADINKDHTNIGIFGSENANKTELSFRYIYGDLYKTLYDDFIENFTDNSLDKIVECKNKYFNVSILDSTFVGENDDNFRSCYSAVEGIVFIFSIDLLSSSTDFISEINQFYKNAKDSVKGELNTIVALRISENDQISDLYKRFYDKIKQIENKFDTKVYLFSNETGENVEDLFFFLLKRIHQKEKQTNDSTKKQKRKKKKKESAKHKKKNGSKKKHHKNTL